MWFASNFSKVRPRTYIESLNLLILEAIFDVVLFYVILSQSGNVSFKVT